MGKGLAVLRSRIRQWLMYHNVLYLICLIFFSGQELEGEGNDRSTLSLPGQQLALLQEAVASGNARNH